MPALTEREIWQQPEAWEWVLNHAPTMLAALEDTAGASEFVFCGCGSAYHVALSCAGAFRAFGIPARAETSSEVYLFEDPARPWRGRALAAVSRSGETSETVFALRHAVSQGAKGVAMTCAPESSLARAAPASLVLHLLNEESVITTKSVTGMILASLIAGDMLSQECSGAQVASLRSLPERCRGALNAAKTVLGNAWDAEKIRQCAFLGAGPLWGVANEARLKMQEMALVPSAAFATLEFRHGPTAQCGPQMLVVAMVSQHAFDAEVSVLQDLAKLGARIFAICERATPELNQAAEFVVELASGLPDHLRQPLYLPPAHLLALQAALSRGLDPDSPPHLARSVVLPSK
jgi:glucosamine--fructose-6-phosphate aminotransferase (isomerizing)